MDKLSDLIKEAKPLYKQRQRRKTITKMILTLSMPAILMSSICQIYLQGNDIYLSLDKNILQSELMSDDIDLLGLH